MNHRNLGLALLLLSAAGVLADAPKPAPKETPPAASSDVQDFVFFTNTRPVLIRMHLRINMQPYSAAWDEYMKKLFAYLDTNNDGLLSKEEAERAPGVQFLKFQFMGVIAGFPAQGNNVPFAEFDKNPTDGKVTLEKLKNYYRGHDMGPLQVAMGQGQGSSEALTEALFKHLDLNQDGKLSREEIAAAHLSLHKLDVDEDEMISKDELVANTNYGQFFFGGNANPLPDNSALMQVTPGEGTGRLIKQLLAHYDKDKNQKLSRAEIGLDAATFDRLDVNKDGQLDVTELAKWLDRPADIELIGRFNNTSGKPAVTSVIAQFSQQLLKEVPLDLVDQAGKPAALASAAKRNKDGTLVMTLGDAQVEVRNNAASFGRTTNRQFFLQQFKEADVKKKGYLDKSEYEKTNFLGAYGFFADRDRDGKLYEKELNAFFDLHDSGSGSFTSLEVGDFGRGLFELIDANNDGRLGLRELRTAWDRLAPWAKEKDGQLAKTDIPRRFQLTLGQGVFNGYRGFAFRGGQGGGFPSGQGKGPLWFRKMDRNGDGDVSQREFLGTAEDFKRIDTDGDGLIDAKEAEKADTWFKNRLQAKP